jgi:hypothetical protein
MRWREGEKRKRKRRREKEKKNKENRRHLFSVITGNASDDE